MSFTKRSLWFHYEFVDPGQHPRPRGLVHLSGQKVNLPTHGGVLLQDKWSLMVVPAQVLVPGSPACPPELAPKPGRGQSQSTGVQPRPGLKGAWVGCPLVAPLGMSGALNGGIWIKSPGYNLSCPLLVPMIHSPHHNRGQHCHQVGAWGDPRLTWES